MKNIVLMNTTEPTDIELKMLMHEVTLDAKSKAVFAHKILVEKIMQEISKVQQKFGAK